MPEKGPYRTEIAKQGGVHQTSSESTSTRAMQTAMFIATEKLIPGQDRLATRQVNTALHAAHHVLLDLRWWSSLFILLQTAAVFFQQGVDQPHTHDQQ